MTESKPYWIGGAKDGRFSCVAIPLSMNSEPLSNKQLHEIIIAQTGTIDVAMTKIGELVDAMKQVKRLIQLGDYMQAMAEIDEVVK